MRLDLRKTFGSLWSLVFESEETARTYRGTNLGRMRRLQEKASLRRVRTGLFYIGT